MGNQLAHESGPGRPARTFGRTGALGLSKADLDKRCKPSGLYPNCHWDEKAIRRLIGDGRLAARLKGSESRSAVGDHECPICFLHYSEVNRTQCCRANICTECFLQIRPQKEKNCVCPFCNNPRLFVSVARRLNNEQLESRQADEQRVIESRIRRRVEEQQNPEQAPAEEYPIESATSGRPGLTSSLENNNDSRMNDVQLLRQLSLTSQDRAALEQEMRAQHTHPLALQVEAEEEQRRIQNEIDYHRNNSNRARMLGQNGGLRGRLSRMTSEPALMSSMGRSGRRNWNDMVEAFGSGGGDVNSLDDMVVLEAAILLSMEEDARRRGEPNSTDTNETSNSVSHHAREGFPMLQERLSSSRAGDSRGDTLSSSMGSRMVPMASPRSRFRRPERSMSAAPPTTLLDSASLLLRGVTEDEQVAMAIALSMQEDSKDAKENGGEKGKSGDGDGVVDENNGSSSSSNNNNNDDDEEEITNTAHEEDGDNSDSTPIAEATSPEACGVAALPESALPQTAFAKMPSNRGIDDDDDYDDDEVGIKLPALRVAGAKTTGDEVVEKGPRLEDGQVSMPMGQPVMVVEDDEESDFVATTES